MENRKLGFGRIACVAAISALVGGAAGGVAWEFLGKRAAMRQSAERCTPLAERLRSCPKSVADLLSLDELKTMTRKAVREHAESIRKDLDVDGSTRAEILFLIDIGKSGDVRLRSVSARCGPEECELRSGWALIIAAEILHGEQLEPPPRACTHGFRVEVPVVDACR